MGWVHSSPLIKGLVDVELRLTKNLMAQDITLFLRSTNLEGLLNAV